MIDDDVLLALLRAWAPLRRLPLVPELVAFHADDELPLWTAIEDATGGRVDAPFFAVAWPGAQALARVVLDGLPPLAGLPDLAGQRVIDLGCGSGLAAIAAARAGASVVAVDVDPLALACARLLARENGVHIETRIGDATDTGVVDGHDVVLAGDVVYNVDVGRAFAGCVRAWRAAGRDVIVADSGRPFFDPAGLAEVRRFEVEVPRGVEGVTTRTVRVYR